MNCAKCGAELIGSRKFCAACGTPAIDPRASPTGAPGAGPYGGAPPSQVNPFAATAMPGSTREKRDSMYGPPPEPSSISQVSPLAASNAVEQRGAFSSTGGAQVAAAQQAVKRIPGTQIMPSTANPAAVTQPRGGGTQLLNAVDGAAPVRPAHPSSGIGAPLSSPAASTGEALARPAISHAPQPPAAPQPMPPPITTPGPYPYAVSAPTNYATPAVQPPPQPTAPPTPAAPQSPFYPGYASYAPGARVQVTWSNGQRYPGTIHQLAGHQCLVVFPDGQQHWVDLQYVSPG